MLARLIVALVLATSTASAAPPCTRCTLDAPAKLDAPVPLVVVLHGDRESASSAVARWRAAVKKRGWVLLGLQCPTDLACKDSWWKWNGDPSWVIDQVAKVAASIKIDPARVYLVGWSGGATYIGRHAQAWETVFAAVMFHGGGHEPFDDACPAHGLPAYFLVGDKNPLHELMKDLRAYFDRCHQDVTGDLVKGGDHDKEDRALDVAKATAILDWFAARRR
jgi:poly(3-hydroxybutyrate) depolymerase